MWLRGVNVAAIIPCMHSPSQCDFVESPIKSWEVGGDDFPFPRWPVSFFDQQKVV